MAELKHNFTAGKMNLDLDERLVPNGEYREATNIQVATSESSNLGTVQNLLSNYRLPQNFITNQVTFALVVLLMKKMIRYTGL